MSKSLVDHYPFPSFRSGAREALELIDAHPEKKYIILSAKTGAGKSPISVALSRKFNCHIVTATKLLQQQYGDTSVFDQEFVLRGKANYTCSHTGANMTLAPCSSLARTQSFAKNLPATFKVSSAAVSNPSGLKSACVSQGVCYYYEKKQKLDVLRGAVLNYDLVLASNFQQSSIVFDESHNFLSKVMDHYSFEYQQDYINDLLKLDLEPPTQHTFKAWLESIKMAADLMLSTINTVAKSTAVSSLKEKAGAILADGALPTQYYVTSEEGVVKIKPLQPKKLVGKLLSRFDRIFFLSATIDPRLPEVLGLPTEDVLMIDVPSTFSAENRPIVFPKDLPNINYRTEFSLDHPAILLLNEILEHHKDHRGLIHTGNYRYMYQLRSLFQNNPRFLWVDRHDNKEDCLRQHYETPGSILVSPSMTEGVDLADDRARFQVILKVPFPAKSEYVDALEQTMPGWYGLCTRNSTVQAYGRIVRSEEDWGTTYVLDNSLQLLLKEGLDSYFLEAVRRGPLDRLIAKLRSGPAQPLYKPKKTLPVVD